MGSIVFPFIAIEFESKTNPQVHVFPWVFVMARECLSGAICKGSNIFSGQSQDDVE